MSLAPLHLGAVHAVEWALSIALVLGPLVALAVTIVVVRRRDALDLQDPATDRPAHEGAS